MKIEDHGKTARGVPITNELIDRLALKAEEGHDIEHTLRLDRPCGGCRSGGAALAPPARVHTARRS